MPMSISMTVTVPMSMSIFMFVQHAHEHGQGHGDRHWHEQRIRTWTWMRTWMWMRTWTKWKKTCWYWLMDCSDVGIVWNQDTVDENVCILLRSDIGIRGLYSDDIFADNELKCRMSNFTDEFSMTVPSYKPQLTTLGIMTTCAVATVRPSKQLFA